MKTRFSIILACLAAFAGAVAASDRSAEEGKARVLRVAERYRGIATYDVNASITMHVESFQGKQSIEGRMRLAGIRPERQYYEMSGNPLMTVRSVMTADSMWLYHGMLNQYTVKPPLTVLQDSQQSGGIEQYFRLSERAEGSRLVRREPVHTPAGERACVVVALTPDTVLTDEIGESLAKAETLWVDLERDLVLKHAVSISGGTAMGDVAMSSIFVYEEYDLENRPPDELFVFSPPPGARRVEEFSGMPAPEASKAVGKPAPPFTLSDLAGKQVSLADQKGKVVLLDFWATWCGPCRIELPHVDKLSRELEPKGLVTLAITSESRDLASGYLKQHNLGLRCLIDVGSKVAESYGVMALPTVVVIDRGGNVSDVLIGLQTEASLRAAVARAGLE